MGTPKPQAFGGLSYEDRAEPSICWGFALGPYIELYILTNQDHLFL